MTTKITSIEADWEPRRVRSLGYWTGGARVREYERPATTPTRKPDNDNKDAADVHAPAKAA